MFRKWFGFKDKNQDKKEELIEKEIQEEDPVAIDEEVVDEAIHEEITDGDDSYDEVIDDEIIDEIFENDIEEEYEQEQNLEDIFDGDFKESDFDEDFDQYQDFESDQDLFLEDTSLTPETSDLIEDLTEDFDEEVISDNEFVDNSSSQEEVVGYEDSLQVDPPADQVRSEEEKEEPKKLSFLDRLKSGLSKTRDSISSAVDNLINGKAEIDDDLYDELEEILISADMGVETTVNTIEELRDIIAQKHIREPKLIKGELTSLLKSKLLERNSDNNLKLEPGKQTVVLVIGVNGVGKTTTIGKLAYNLQAEGKKVIVAAGDTFRAAAIEQLSEWADRVRVDLVKNVEGSDPASIVYDAIHAQKANNADVLLIDTAGRLHNKKNLMNELEKINRIIDREHPNALRETLLVLDATTGQNAVFQAKEFNKVTDISGIILTKLDGTAKGGVVFPLQLEHEIPVKYIGIGEQKDNLEKFDSEKFVEALF